MRALSTLVLLAGLTGSVTAQAPAEVLTAPTGVAEAIDPRAKLFYDRVWFKADYVVWWASGQSVVPLVSVVPAGNINLNMTTPGDFRAGQVYPRGDTLRFDAFNGVRATVGGTINDSWGVELSGFYLGDQDDSVSFFGNGAVGSPGIARGYISAGNNTNTLLYFNLPGEYSGGVTVAASTEAYGLEVNARRDWYRLLADKTDLIFGFRYLSVEDTLNIDSVSVFPNAGGSNRVIDNFKTTNHFYGPQVGVQQQIGGLRWFTLDQTFKIAVGGVHQTAVNTGSYVGALADGTVVERLDGGLYTSGGNRGSFSRDKFASVLEYGLNLGLHLRENVRLQIGYNIIYQSSVARTGSVIDPVVNDSRLPYVNMPPMSDSQRPLFDFNRVSKDYWLQGINLGVVVAY